MKYFVSLIMIIAGALSIQAQDTAAITRAMNLFHRVQAKSLQEPVSFELRYTYSNEHTPAILLDSLQGSIEMDGKNYRCIIDSTETIRNNKYSIVLFKQDKVMYLSGTGTTTAPVDPLETLSSFLKEAANSTCTFSHEKSNTIINITFAPESPCKRLSITIDTLSQRLIAMQYILKTSMLMNEEMQHELPEGYEEYAEVKASFFNYKRTVANNSRYDEKTFFYKDGETLKVTPPYEDYSIFVGTPDL